MIQIGEKFNTVAGTLIGEQSTTSLLARAMIADGPVFA
jgi:hypothetical protein